MRKNFSVAWCIVSSAGAALGCASADPSVVPLAEESQAILPCNLNAPFKAPVKLLSEPPAPPNATFPFTTYDFDGLTFSGNGDRMYLSSPHLIGTSYDIMRSNRSGTVYSDPVVIDPLNTMNNDDRAPNLRADGNTIFIHRNVGGFNDIFRATKLPTDPEFGAPLPYITGPNHDQDPFYLELDNNLFFASERDNSTIKDIYRLPPPPEPVVRLPQGTTKVNHPDYDDYRPVVTSDGLTLYFASKRPGIGGDTDGDIWMSTRASTNVAFGLPVRLDILNRSGRDFPVAISADKCTLYLASNQDTGLSGTDHYRLYTATRGENVLPTVPLTIQISGTGSITTPPFNCSHVGPGFGGTGTCTASLAPGTVQQINASGPSTYTGSCTGWTVPDSNALAIWAEGGICKVTIQ